MLRLSILGLAALLALPAGAAAQALALPQMGVEGSGTCRGLKVRNATNGAQVALGCMDTGTNGFRSTPEVLTLPATDRGSTGDVSGLSVKAPGVPAGQPLASWMTAPIFSGAISAGACDTGQWSPAPDGSQSPIPRDYCVKSAPTISNAYPGVVGIGKPAGDPVPANDQTYLQRAQHLVQARTLLDNTKQESALGINFVNRTGGGGLPQTNHNQKVALSVFALGLPGGSNMWGINTDVHMHAGVGDYPFFGREADHTNFNKDYAPGAGAVAFGDYLTFTGFPMTAGLEMSGNPNPGSKSLYYGILFQSKSGFDAIGTGLISDATIVDGTNSRSVLKLYGNHDTVLDTFDGNVARIVTAKAGQGVCLNGIGGCIVYDAANGLLNLNGGRLLVGDSGAVRATGSLEAPLMVAPGTTALGLGNDRGVGLRVRDAGGTLANLVSVQPTPAGFGPILKAEGADANIPLNLQAKGASPVQVLGPLAAAGAATVTGTLTASGPLVQPTSSTPASSAAACTTGQHTWDANFEYRCVAANTWKRAALSTW